MLVGNLNKNSLKEDLYELFGLRNTTYLKDNCCVKNLFSKPGLLRDFTFRDCILSMKEEGEGEGEVAEEFCECHEIF